MDGASEKFGAVTCVREVKHPIHAAHAVLDRAQQKICFSIWVGDGSKFIFHDTGSKVLLGDSYG